MSVRDQLCHVGVAAADGGVVLAFQASCEIEGQQKATGSGGRSTHSTTTKETPSLGLTMKVAGELALFRQEIMYRI